MPLTLRPDVVAEIIRRVLDGRDHRDVVVDMLDAAFVSNVIDFFEQVVRAKMRNGSITQDWYRDYFLDEQLEKQEFAMNGGLNLKTINNKRKSTKKQIVVDETREHYDKFLEMLDSLNDDSINVDLSLTFRDVTVHLDLNESLIVINALAVRRAAMRGGLWSTTGKQVEGPLMEVLCRVFAVDEQYFTGSLGDYVSLREVDFYLRPPYSPPVKCEVKLMGKGNPEGADAIHARDTKVFVASTLSETNKKQLDDAGVLWTQLQEPNGFLRFQQTLAKLEIPYSELLEVSDHTEQVDRAIRDTLSLGHGN